MWIPISIDKFLKLHLKKNPNEIEKVLRVRIEAALNDYKNGVKCQCGKDLWIVGSVSAPFGCFSCITGKEHPLGDYEIDSALDKRDKYGRRNIDEMDSIKIAGMFIMTLSNRTTFTKDFGMIFINFFHSPVLLDSLCFILICITNFNKTCSAGRCRKA